MKLLHCGTCLTIINLDYEIKTCKCGSVKGKYLRDGLNAVYSGDDATPLGIDNMSFHHALAMQPEEGLGKRFEAFVIPEKCPTFVKVADVE